MSDGCDDLFSAIDTFLGDCRAADIEANCRSYWSDHPCLSRADIQLLSELGREAFCPLMYADRSGRDRAEGRRLLEALTGIGLLERCQEGYAVADSLLLYCRSIGRSGELGSPNTGAA